MGNKNKILVFSILIAIIILAMMLLVTETEIFNKSGIFYNQNYNTIVSLVHPLDEETYITYDTFFLQALVGTDAPLNEVYFNIKNDDTGTGWAWNLGSTTSSGKTMTLSSNYFKNVVYRENTNYSWWITVWSNDVLIWSNSRNKWHFDTYTSNIPPVADAGGPYSGFVGKNIYFDGTESYDPDGTIVSWVWDLNGDGVFETYYDKFSSPMPFDSAGVYTIYLKVTDNNGAFDIDETTVTLSEENLPPVADADGPYSGKINETITFYGSGSYDTDGEIVNFLWDIDGDGNFDIDGEIVSFKYNRAGNYTVTLKTIDDGGSYSTDTTYAVITSDSQPVPPTPEPPEDTNYATYILIVATIVIFSTMVGIALIKKD